MRILFSLLSFFYVTCIFFLAGSPVARTLSEFNPYSLLHIPLYGILAFLLVFSIVPVSQAVKVGGDSTKRRFVVTNGLTVRLFVAGMIALAIGIFDEIHQLYVPGRDASAGDVLLDLAGITIALFLCFWFFKIRFLNRSTQPANPTNSITE